jgi:monofunctional biosynthetic peptidoglycan transglycosylase
VAKSRKRRRWFRALVLALLGAVVAFYVLSLAALVGLRWIDPPTTMVQAQRRVEAWLAGKPYQKRQQWQPLSRIAPVLQHAVIAAEDGRFYQHHGIDWQEVQKVIGEDAENGKAMRGASTITQQLVKNLFFTTSRSPVRKAVESTLAPAADWILPKQRILELYLNLIEWGPGVYGAESASRFWYTTSAEKLDREQAARLAAVIPSPLRWKPARMGNYSSEILRRMGQTNW